MFFSTRCHNRDVPPSTAISGLRTPCAIGLILIIVIALVAGLAPRSAFAQDSDSSQSGDNSGSDGIRSFESVTVDRIKPHDLPTQSKPGAPVGIRTQPEDLPKAPTEEQLGAVRDRVSAATVRLAMVKTPRRPYRQEPRVSFGHAVWVDVPGTKDDSTKGDSADDDIALITTLDWLSEADAVYLVPDPVAAEDRKSQDWMKVRQRTLQSVTAGAEGREWYEKNKEELVELQLERRDKHRNLVTLSTGPEHKTAARPLTLFPYSEKGLFYAYGYSPFFGHAIAQTTISPTHPDKVALSFYFQTSFPAALGAPIVSDQGKLVTITAFRHPDDANVTLAIPTQAIESYLAPEYARKKREDDDPTSNSRARDNEQGDEEDRRRGDSK